MPTRTPWPPEWIAAVLPLVALVSVAEDGRTTSVVHTLQRTNLVADGGRVLACLEELRDAGLVVEAPDREGFVLTDAGVARLELGRSLWPSFARIMERSLDGSLLP